MICAPLIMQGVRMRQTSQIHIATLANGISLLYLMSILMVCCINIQEMMWIVMMITGLLNVPQIIVMERMMLKYSQLW